MGRDDREREQREQREQRRKAKVIIRQLRQHQQKVEEDKDEAVDCRSNVLSDHFQRAKDNLGKSQTVDQALLDAQIFHRLGQYSKRQAAHLQTGLQTINIKTFTDSLTVHMRRANQSAPMDDENESEQQELRINFVDLGNSVWRRWKSAPSMDFMHGNAPRADNQVVAEAKKKRRVKKGSVAEKPSELTAKDVEQTETDIQVAEMKRELQKREQCNYWILVIDPNCYSRSIENVFHSSFLIKDSIASLDLKRDPPIISYKRSRDRRDGASGYQDGGNNENKTSEFIMGFDKNVWLEVINKYNIRQCILPSKRENRRPDSQLQRLNGLAEEESDKTVTF